MDSPGRCFVLQLPEVRGPLDKARAVLMMNACLRQDLVDRDYIIEPIGRPDRDYRVLDVAKTEVLGTIYSENVCTYGNKDLEAFLESYKPRVK